MTKTLAVAVAAGLLVLPGATLRSQSRVPCDPDNGGLTLPVGFCATVFADGVGAGGRIAVAANGDVLVNTTARPGGGGAGSVRAGAGGVVLLRDVDGDGRSEVVQQLGGSGGAGLAIANGYLYATATDAIVRWKYAAGTTVLGAPDTVISGLYSGGHAAWNFAVAGDVLYLNVGSLTESCEEDERQSRSKGVDPCPELSTRGGIWEYDANRSGQTVHMLFERRSRSLGEALTAGTLGATTRREVGNAVTSMRASGDSARSALRVPETLGGRVAGVTILRNDGSVGAGASIRMRGINSFRQGNRPLFYVDGVRVFAENLPATVSQQASSPLDDINPSDIERIEILKGAAATALYGTEAANGVVHVFTRNGAPPPQAPWEVTVTESPPVPPPRVADGNWFATGIHNAAALAVDPHDGALWAAMQGNDRSGEGKVVSNSEDAQSSDNQISRVRRGDDFGWPYCVYSGVDRKLVDAPAYGGDGRTSGLCEAKKGPEVAFPPRWAPADMMFYTGDQFPAEYSSGLFILLRDAGRGAAPSREGFHVAFVPVSGGAPGPQRAFAEGPTSQAARRASSSDFTHPQGGVAQAPDGSIYVLDDVGGTIWRIGFLGASQTSTRNSSSGEQ